MKELRGHAVRDTRVPVKECFALLVAVDRYASWLDFVREVSVLERDGNGCPATVRAKLHVAQSPIGKDFDVLLSVWADGQASVRLTRLPSDASDRERLELYWSLRKETETRIDLEFLAAVSFLPGFLPLGGVGDLIAERILEAAAAALTDR